MPKISAATKTKIRSALRKFGKRAGAKAVAEIRKSARSGQITRIARRIGGSNAGTIAHAITGHGDYNLHKYHLSRGIHDKGRMGARGHGTGHGSHVKLEKGEMVIEHSEFLGDLISPATTNTFGSQSYSINPGLIGTFPWLSSVASQFQMYQFDKLVFEFRSMTSQSTSSTAGALVGTGQVVMATQYDSVSGSYPNKAQMENSDFSISTAPYDSAMHAVECHPKYNPLGVQYIRSGTTVGVSTVPNSDIRMYDLGIFQIASNGIPTNGSSIDLGEIWVHYKVRLYKPQLNGGLTNILSYHAQWVNTTGTTTTPFTTNGTVLAPTFIDGNNTLVMSNTASSLIFPLAITEGNFMVTVYVTNRNTANNAALTNWGISGANCTLLTSYPTNGGVEDGQNIAASQWNGTVTTTASATYVYQFIVSVNAPGANVATITFGAPGANILTGTASTSVDVFITQWNSLMST